MRDNCAPNFFILGAAKAGTTTLYETLRRHPEVFMSFEKETQFFFNDQKYARGMEFYLNRYFVDAGGYPARGEASPSYFQSPATVAPRLRDSLSPDNLRFIVILRDPVERAWSHYLHRRRVYAEKYAFVEAMAHEEERLVRDPALWVGYYRDGLYGKLVTEWFRYFRRDQFLFLDYEDLHQGRDTMLEQICLHLNVNPKAQWPKEVVSNAAGVPRNRLFMKTLQKPRPYLRIFKKVIDKDRISRVRRRLNRLNTRVQAKPAMDAELARWLRRQYAPDIERLESLLGREFEHWKVPSADAGGNRDARHT